ncbi:flavodoxin domain-containing protein [Jonesia denitrificans]|uniref:Protoporphyrinogen oxidase n=1 Tax=Jonesia denitrificans (strain ATCC 14870 / DSM 20603 / BCRC 15368 / CIP 55.134 / JCM 11481 / NBRC 15587 / NCTC 10816 / Prevot 55134) TaxID=471856 RepID=C7R0T0_JONDD|nr:flavodoxin domain-containing protein [Jonesia denitrificans]ACV08237.1 protoporphyrinogen oxidase [Jonesia denitrificans DSM 20603]ASE08093.1 protoporphyrinogen oxidase [Jonesia denitrificans]QXB42697.1 flavodoxin domain-containing protein [Jonesia denitrificans]SQH20218.1 Protoporphyrinogen IX dehydrogenase [menaquinone] [Jonesia denitrificans]
MRVLVTAASRHGSTREIAAEIAATIRATGIDAIEREPRDVINLDGYDAVILGSAIYVGQWLGDAKDFADRHAEALRERRTWLFSSGLANQPSKDANNAPALLARMQQLQVEGHRHFPGKLDVLQLSLAERAAIMAARGKYGDSRDMNAVRAWARDITSALTAVPSRS